MVLLPTGLFIKQKLGIRGGGDIAASFCQAGPCEQHGWAGREGASPTPGALGLVHRSLVGPMQAQKPAQSQPNPKTMGVLGWFLSNAPKGVYSLQPRAPKCTQGVPASSQCAGAQRKL